MRQLQAMSLLKDQTTASSLENEARAQAIRNAAAEKIDANNDVVKHLTSISATASAFTLRGKQLEEKQQRADQEREYERRMDILMEVDRLRDLKRREDEEREKLYKRHEDRKVITEQIDERHRMKVLAAEAREQENQAMLATIKRYEAEDARAAERRRLEVEQSRLEVVKANEAAIQKKLDAKLDERREVEEILLYQRRRDEEMKRREDEEAERDRAKIARQAQLLAEQERVINNADKRDELLARRFAEDKARREREKERAARMKKLDDARMLMASRERAAEDKRRVASQLKASEMYEVERAREYDAVIAQREQREQRAKYEAAVAHREGILRQVQELERQRVDLRTNKFAEGRALLQQEQSELAKYEGVRARMVRDSEGQGVDPRFLAKMRAVSVEKLIKRDL